jgi:hypothetical protein
LAAFLPFTAYSLRTLHFWAVWVNLVAALAMTWEKELLVLLQHICFYSRLEKLSSNATYAVDAGHARQLAQQP